MPQQHWKMRFTLPRKRRFSTGLWLIALLVSFKIMPNVGNLLKQFIRSKCKGATALFLSSNRLVLFWMRFCSATENHPLTPCLTCYSRPPGTSFSVYFGTDSPCWICWWTCCCKTIASLISLKKVIASGCVFPRFVYVMRSKSDQIWRDQIRSKGTAKFPFQYLTTSSEKVLFFLSQGQSLANIYPFSCYTYTSFCSTTEILILLVSQNEINNMQSYAKYFNFNFDTTVLGKYLIQEAIQILSTHIVSTIFALVSPPSNCFSLALFPSSCLSSQSSVSFVPTTI